MRDPNKFKGLADRIASIMSDDYPSPVNVARCLPDDYAKAINGFRISKEYSGLSKEENELAQRTFSEMKRQERARGEAERRQRLLALSAELEAARAVLPQMAAQLAIEMGARARALAEEARKDVS